MPFGGGKKQLHPFVSYPSSKSQLPKWGCFLEKQKEELKAEDYTGYNCKDCTAFSVLNTETWQYCRLAHLIFTFTSVEYS